MGFRSSSRLSDAKRVPAATTSMDTSAIGFVIFVVIFIAIYVGIGLLFVSSWRGRRG